MRKYIKFKTLIVNYITEHKDEFNQTGFLKVVIKDDYYLPKAINHSIMHGLISEYNLGNYYRFDSDYNYTGKRPGNSEIVMDRSLYPYDGYICTYEFAISKDYIK